MCCRCILERRRFGVVSKRDEAVPWVSDVGGVKDANMCSQEYQKAVVVFTCRGLV